MTRVVVAPRFELGGGGGGDVGDDDADEERRFDGTANDDNPPNQPKLWTLEQALDRIGAGAYQRMALLTTGLANAADAAEILAIGLVLPAAKGDLSLDAHPWARSAITSSVFLGMLLGGLIFGPLGDRAGRRPTLALSLLINGACGALSALAPSASLLALARFFAGVGVGGSVPVVFAWLAEVVPRAARGQWLVFLAAFWMVGSLFSATLGLLIIPRAGWRLFLLAVTAPAFGSAACSIFLMDESPRQALVRGRPEVAARTLRRMAAMNGRPFSPARGGFALAPLPVAPIAPAAASSSTPPLRAWLARSLLPYKQLLKPPLRQKTIPLLLGMAGISGGWYSLILWLPSYFERRGAAVGAGLYTQTLAVSAANLPGNIASAFLVDRAGRRATACGSMALAGLAALAFALAPPTPGVSLASACVFNGVSVIGWNSLDLLGSESFPTSVRASAVGLMGAAGRLASFASTAAAGWLTDVWLALPLFVAAGLLVGGGLAMLRLPEPAMQPLEDVSCGGGGGGGAVEMGSSAASSAAVVVGVSSSSGAELGGGAGAREEEGEGASLLRGGAGATVVSIAPLFSPSTVR
jgi:MFS family permease